MCSISLLTVEAPKWGRKREVGTIGLRFRVNILICSYCMYRTGIYMCMPYMITMWLPLYVFGNTFSLPLERVRACAAAGK